MPSWLQTLDPDVRQVLEDVVRDSRSRMFRLDASMETPGPLAEIAPFSAAAAGWRPAERHLLQNYREELWLCVHAAYTERARQDTVASATSLLPSRTTDGALDLSSSFQLWSEKRHFTSLDTPVRTLVEVLVRSDGLGHVPLRSFAVAARALLDSASTRLVGSQVDLWQLNVADALDVARLVGTRTLRSDLAGTAWSIAGVALSHQGAHGDSGRAFLLAASHEPERTPYWINVFLAGLLTKDRKLMSAAEEVLDERAAEVDLSLLAAQYQSLRELGRVTSLDHAELAPLLDHSSPTCQEIAHVLVR